MKNLLLFTFIVLSLILKAEMVVLNDGREFEGEVIGKEGNYLYFYADNQEKHKIHRTQIKKIKNNAGAEITNKTFKKKDWKLNSSGDFVEIKGAKFEENKPSISLSSNSKGIVVEGVNLDSLNIEYCEIFASTKTLGKFWTYIKNWEQESNIIIDYGQNLKVQEKQKVQNNKGVEIKFNGIVDALNYFEKNGWTFVSQYFITHENIGGDAPQVLHILLRKKKK